ncbi:hypothetical protein FQR65_LT13567 [Abscondita terminalis]|nr:hypothetical protein FQR65_LT13567 [Abscondita terminalis]
MIPKLILALEIILLSNFCDKVWSVVFVDGFFDHADVYCGNKLDVSTETYESWFNQEMEIIDEESPVSQEFMNCWMTKRGITNENADLVNDVLMAWLQDDVYMYVLKEDIEKYPLEGRKAAVTTILNECKKMHGVENNIKNHVVHIYNCLIIGVSKL